MDPEAQSRRPSLLRSVNQPISEKIAVVLREYQEEVINACLKALATTLTRIGVSSPTGSGKTTMFIDLIPKVATTGRPPGERGQTLILVGSTELATQAMGAARDMLGPDWSIELEQGSNRASGLADVTVTMYQTLNRNDRLKKYEPSRFSLVIVDEAHHAAAKSYLCILHHFNEGVKVDDELLPSITPDHGHKVPIVGFTATFTRADDLALSAVFEKIVYDIKLVRMMELGWLTPIVYKTVIFDFKLGSIPQTVHNDYNAVDVARSMDRNHLNSQIVGSWIEHASTRRSTVVFGVDRKHVKNLKQTFISAKIDARSITGDMVKEERHEVLLAFRRGDLPVLINCMLLTEGVDIPPIDCIILARPSKHAGHIAQMMGRGLRPSPETGKVNCLIMHMVDSKHSLRARQILDVVPTLLGKNLELRPRDRRSRRATDRRFGLPPDLSSTCTFDPAAALLAKVTHEEEGSPFAPAKTVRLEKAVPFIRSVPVTPKTASVFECDHLARLSPNAWVDCGGDRYVLVFLKGGKIVISAVTDATNGTERKFATVYYARNEPPRTVSLSVELAVAMRHGDSFARHDPRNDDAKLLLRSAEWRLRPVSPRALGMIVTLKGDVRYDGQDKIEAVGMLGEIVKVADITQGDASTYICMLLHQASAASRQRGHPANGKDTITKSPPIVSSSSSKTSTEDPCVTGRRSESLRFWMMKYGKKKAPNK